MIDLDPPPEGTRGQVILYDHEVGPMRVVAPSFSAWLARIAAALEAGKLVWREQARQVEPLGRDQPGGCDVDWESTWGEPATAADGGA
jgi:hypothetical protein